MSTLLRIFLLVIALVAVASTQWFNYPTAGLPRTSDGKPDLAAPTQKTADGKPDLSGIWLPADGSHFTDLAVDLKPEEPPYQPWAKALAAQREAGVHKADPLAQCMPPGVPRVETHGGHPFKIIQMPRELVILYETSTNDVFREIFTDGRPLPKETQPSWKGYSVGKWEGDTMVVDTIGFNDRSWLDTAMGRPQTEALHITERFRRRNVGNMEIGITIDDPKAYTKPWNAKINLKLVPDTELIETVCENSRNVEHMVGK
ncbi:MAG TPA: hypothetical protein VGR73_21895 [Bryobacteraceae bacterium]|nr:hypothetical protein [Bryobacteraceae bacterium]